MNGDGFSDVIVGAPYFDSGFVDQGRAFAFQGSAAGLNVVASPALGLQYGGASALFGFSVSTAGDVNGDGYSDVIIGHPGYGGTGGAVVYLGGVFGLTTSTGGGGNLSGQAGAQRGFSVACAGDVNADGYSDVLVGEPGYDTPGGVVDAGAFFLWLGSPSGVVTGSRTVSLLSQPGIRFGHCVAGVGDVNGDGRSDYAIGAPGYTLFQVGEGRVFIYGLGSPFSQNFNGGQVGAAFGESI
ncbi:MAG: FG-GAP repeat protein, partial [Flavobacteriales bacterium]|nr:FG-GAP repeat protein [Flavobacteriales bacterium]